MTKLYFIGGASGSGKTAIMNELQNILDDKIKVYDFDDIGVLEGADKKWRQESTAKWLQKLLNEGKDACLLGQIVLGEILACPSANQIDKVNFCLLDVSDIQRIQRLKKRSTYGADQNMLNWSAWLRMHHQDPKWTQHVLKEDCWNGLEFSNWDQLESWDDKASIELLDTTNFSIENVARKVADWINRKLCIANLINDKVYNVLKNFEESLWLEETRFDNQYMDKILDTSFFEYGRSGKTYARDEVMSHPAQTIGAKIPLENFKVHDVSDNVKLVTYISEVGSEKLRANRSSLWVHEKNGWKLRFHQGTPI
ncbi:hypothetical protein SC371_03685 [Legionella pneumophila serogroup 2]|nr:hypothetical protein [Legionella pneumophila]